MRTKPYCNAPWIGLSYESSVGCKPCCEYIRGESGSAFRGRYTDYIKSDYLKDFKKMMYEDDMSEGCKICIDNERNNDDSTRLKMLRHKVNYKSNDNKLVKFDFRPGNKCNLMCRMCHSEASSMREEEEIKFNNAKPVFRVEDMSDAYDIDLSKCEELMILGGEPSIDLEVRKWIDHIKDFNTHVIITTNGTNASDKWFESLKKLKSRLSIWLSIDATGDINDFQRKGSDWKQLKSNIIKYKKEFENKISIQLTASAINFTTLDVWWDEFMKLDIPTYYHAVIYPKEYSLKAIPDKYKDAQIQWLEDWISKESKNDRQKTEAKGAIELLKTNRYDKKYNESFKREVKKMDGWRNENINDLDYRFEEILNAN